MECPIIFFSKGECSKYTHKVTWSVLWLKRVTVRCLSGKELRWASHVDKSSMSEAPQNANSLGSMTQSHKWYGVSTLLRPRAGLLSTTYYTKIISQPFFLLQTEEAQVPNGPRTLIIFRWYATWTVAFFRWRSQPMCNIRRLEGWLDNRDLPV